METNELLELILKELQENNRMLKTFLTNHNEATEDAMHSYIASIDIKMDGIVNNITKLVKDKK